jgi:serine/threonine-protein kinase
LFKTSLICGALVAALLALAPARTASAASKKEQAEEHYDQGKAYYRAGAFDLAIQEFLEGYKLDPKAGVLFNIARGYEELKNRDKAIEFYKKYIDQGAQATAATEARARLVVLERQAKEDADHKATAVTPPAVSAPAVSPPAVSPAPTPMPAPVETKPAPEPNAAAAPAPASGPEGTVTATAPAPAEPPSDTARTMRIAGLVTGGAGVVLLGVGTYFGLHASSLKSEIQMEKTYSASKDSDYNSASTLAVVGLVGGAVVAAGGAVLYLLGSRQKDEGAAPSGAAPSATASLVPAVGRDGAALFFTRRF